jgi:ABC-type multidrug transport system ATPase subunit
MTDLLLDHTASPAPAARTGRGGVRLEARGASRHAGGRQTLHDVSLTIDPGELVAVAGGSGAGKTTLLALLAGLNVPSAGVVTHDGTALGPGGRRGSGIGYVPQDDVLHRALPLGRTLRYTARLRLPAGTPRAVVDRLVDETLDALDLADRAAVPVRALSGGQRKRASIAAELLTHPRVLFLDEPTSGLDPATSADVMRLLRRLACRGVTVVLTTHQPADLERCDRVVFLARDGHLAFAGPPAEACRYFQVSSLTEVYQQLAAAPPAELAARFARHRPPAVPTPPAPPTCPAPAPPGVGRPGPVAQCLLLARRNVDLLIHNRLTLAILLGSPALVTAMMAMLFRAGSFEAGGRPGTAPAQVVFWLAFAGFFFGLTYGLLQVVGELSVLRRERLAGLGIGAYVAAKFAVLLPVLAGVVVVLLGALRALDRLPARGGDVYPSVFLTLLLASGAALALGLLASSAVGDAAQAALALPMLCFPQVLFAGAIVPVDDMTAPAQGVAAVLATRHAYEAVGRILGLDPAGGPVSSWLTLAGFTLALLLATVSVLHRRCRPAGQG